MKLLELRRLILLIFLSLAIRSSLLWVVYQYPERMIRRDSSPYLQIASNLRLGNGFSENAQQPYKPDVVHTPVYPIFILGVRSLGGDSSVALAIAQMLLSALTVGLIYFLNRQLFSITEATSGAVLFSVSLLSLTHAVFIMTETVFTFLLLCTFTSLIVYRLKRKTVFLLIAGLFGGIAILCRPVGLYYPLVAALWVAWAGPFPRIRRFGHALIFLLVAYLTIFPWLARNRRLLGEPILSTISSYNLYYYNAVALQANLEGRSESEVRAEFIAQAQIDRERLGWDGNPALEMRYYRQTAMGLILSHPVRYIFVHLKGDIGSLLPNINELTELLGYTQGAQGTLSVFNQYGLEAAVKHYFGDRLWLVWLLLPFILILGLTYLGALGGTVVMLRQRRVIFWALFALTIAYFLLLPGAPSNPRFRLPVMPMICGLAGVGLVYLWNTFTRWARQCTGPGEPPVAPVEV